MRTALFGAVGALVALIAVPTLAQAQRSDEELLRDKYERARQRHSQFQLFSGPTVVLNVNQFQCGLSNNGETCVDIFDSPTGNGGFWPTGSPNGYMFNSGLNMGGIIPADAGFAWAGDTTGAYFFDARGSQRHGEAITEIFNSLDRDDLANWPAPGFVPDFPELTAFVTDEALFNPVLLGLKAASQQDSWVVYWDGSPDFVANREHPMGILVEQRTLAWNFPEGNEATVYFIFNFTNITNTTAFQLPNEARFFGGDPAGIPDAGYRIDSIFVASDTDPDVTTSATLNYSTAILPFNMGIAYHGDFVADEFDFPASLFHPPFFTNAPGIIGVKYLKSPIDPATGEEVGLTLFSVHQNPGSIPLLFPDPLGVKQLWRYLSGNITPGLGDNPCTFPNPKERKICFQAQTQADTRFFIASGPFSLNPGESATIVVAMLVGATVETTQITLGSDNPPGIPSVRPGCESEPILPIEVGAGWVATQPAACTGTPAPGTIDQFLVDVVPGSLLGKALATQTVFDNQFLLAFAPEKPEFFLVPGDRQVTVLWAESTTEQNGDPFFAATSDPTNALVNPNYREFDIEGYRIFRGTSPAELKLIAQFDKDDSSYIDETCETDPTFVSSTDVCTPPDPVNIVDPFVQFPSGGIARLEDGREVVTAADTALSAAVAAGEALPLSNSGIPFAFVDPNVDNGFRYFYKVTAFDINSLKSGPTSLVSSGDTKSTFPQKPAPNQVLASFSSSVAGDDGVPLDFSLPIPTLDPDDGTFSGPFPPTDALTSFFAPEVPRLLPSFTRIATIDSIVLVDGGPVGGVTAACPLGTNPFFACWAAYVSVDVDGTVTQQVSRGLTPWWIAFGDNAEEAVPVLRAEVPLDADGLAQFGIPTGFVSSAAVDFTTKGAIGMSASEGPQARRFTQYHGGSRWFDGDSEAGANSTVTDPTAYIRVGSLSAVDTVWKPVSHVPLVPGGPEQPNAGVAFEKQCFNRALSLMSRAADVRFTWGGGTFSEVRDVTHNTAVPFSGRTNASWGFLTTDANGNGFLDWRDFNHVDGALQILRNLGDSGGGFCDEAAPGGPADWDPGSVLTPVDLVSTPSIVPTSTDGLGQTGIAGLVQTGVGFGLYVNGERYIFETASLPADGTVWTLRSYSGVISVSDEDAADPSGYKYATTITGLSNSDGTSSRPLRPPLIPGLTFTFVSETATELVGESDLSLVHTVPDPYYAVSQFDLGPVSKELRFVNLPAQSTIRIYSVAGVLVDIIVHDDPAGGGQATWNLRNRSNQFVASGVYFFHVTTPAGKSRIGKFTIVNFAN